MTLKALLENNKKWAVSRVEADPGLFQRLVHQQAPEYLWIGCSDSRVPANEIVGLDPGEMFVHRNIANVVVHTDLNCLSVLQYAVDILKVRHVMVVGHYGCGGVRAAWNPEPLGLVDSWLRHVEDVAARHKDVLDTIQDEQVLLDTLSELNVLTQVVNVCRTTVMRDAWLRGQGITVHGLIYGLSDGLLRNLNLSMSSAECLDEAYQTAIATILTR